MTLPYAALLASGRRPTTIVTLEWAGGRHYFADSNVVPDDAPSGFGPCEPADLTEIMAVASPEPQFRSIAVAVAFPSHVSVPTLVDQGHDVSLAVVEVAYYVSGAWADRVVVLVGRVIEPTYTTGGIVRFTAEENAYDDAALWPPSDAYVDAATWVGHDPAVRGRYYPWVFGSPGVYTAADGDDAYTSGSPGLLVNTASRYLLIAGHEVDASTVTVIKRTGSFPQSKTFNVSLLKDALGRRCSVCVLDAGPAGVGTLTAEEGADYWVRWASGGGIPARETTRAVRGGAELLLWWLERSTLRYDAAGIRGLSGALDGYVFDGYVDEPIRPWDVIIGSLLPVLPATPIYGHRGLTFAVFDPDATVADAVAHLTDGVGLVLDDEVSYEGRDAYAKHTINFAYRPDDKTFLRHVTLGATEDTAPRLGSRSYSPLGHVARTGYGATAAAPAVDAAWVQDEGTARRCLRWRQVVYGLPRRLMGASAHPSYGWLRPGDVVTLTSAPHAMAHRLARVASTAWDGSAVRLTLAFYPTVSSGTRT